MPRRNNALQQILLKLSICIFVSSQRGALAYPGWYSLSQLLMSKPLVVVSFYPASGTSPECQLHWSLFQELTYESAANNVPLVFGSSKIAGIEHPFSVFYAHGQQQGPTFNGPIEKLAIRSWLMDRMKPHTFDISNIPSTKNANVELYAMSGDTTTEQKKESKRKRRTKKKQKGKKRKSTSSKVSQNKEEEKTSLTGPDKKKKKQRSNSSLIIDGNLETDNDGTLSRNGGKKVKKDKATKDTKDAPDDKKIENSEESEEEEEEEGEEEEEDDSDEETVKKSDKQNTQNEGSGDGNAAATSISTNVGQATDAAISTSIAGALRKTLNPLAVRKFGTVNTLSGVDNFRNGTNYTEIPGK